MLAVSLYEGKSTLSMPSIEGAIATIQKHYYQIRTLRKAR